MPENTNGTSLAKYSTLYVENCDRQTWMWEKEKLKRLTEAPFPSLKTFIDMFWTWCRKYSTPNEKFSTDINVTNPNYRNVADPNFKFYL